MHTIRVSLIILCKQDRKQLDFFVYYILTTSHYFSEGIRTQFCILLDSNNYFFYFLPYLKLLTIILSHDFVLGTISQVLKNGYKLKDRVLRPAQVGTVA